MNKRTYLIGQVSSSRLVFQAQRQIYSKNIQINLTDRL